MYAGTRVNWHEVLLPNSNKASNDDSLPLFLCVFSADKGSEEITDLVYSDFKKMYGDNADFFKYGQPLIQAHRILAAGGRVLGKRIVADDATLANLIITAEVTASSEHKKSPDGQQIYIDEHGNETLDVTDHPAVVNFAKVKYATVTVEDAANITAVEAKAEELLESASSTGVYPLFIVCDNGRGTSIKKIRISPDYNTSKKLPYMLYHISDVENTTTVETKRFSVYPEAVNMVNGQRRNMVLNKTTMLQLDAMTYSAGSDAFIAKLAEATGYSVEDLYGMDPLFGNTVKGKPVSAIRIDESGLDISSEYGMALASGSNGAFGDAPWNGENVPGPEDPWTLAAVKYFDGTFSDEIYDLDQHKIDFCVDAAYPDPVKNAIVDLANFRGDFFYFRDLGLNVHNLSDVVDKVDDLAWPRSCFVGDYMSTYDVIDTFSHKQINVTMCLGLAPLLVNHFKTNVAAPIAGEFNNFIITDAVPDTLNIIPRVSPTFDQKEVLDDLKVNFVNLTSDRLLAIQSTYSSQDHNGPLSYASNVIVTQMVIKAIRRYCPKIRFMLMDPGATDFGKYKKLIEDNVIDRWKQHFKSIELKYTRDDEQIANKIFNASLYCYYRDFPQGEVFDVFAIEGSPDTNPMD